MRYKFVEWRDEAGNVIGTEPTLAFFLDKSSILTAVYEKVQTYVLNIKTTVGGNTDPPPGSYEYYEGTIVTVTAIPEATYRFEYWEIDGEIVTDNPITILMDRNYSLTAHFQKLQEYKLTIKTTEGGTTDPEPGTYTYVEGTTVTVTAIPDTGYRFSYWELTTISPLRGRQLAIRTENPISLTMNSDMLLTAYFSKIEVGRFRFDLLVPIVMGLVLELKRVLEKK